MTDLGTPLIYRAGYKYRVEREFRFPTHLTGMPFVISDLHGRTWAKLEIDGNLWAAEGYCYDGPSGPTIDTPDSMRGALCHDVPYQASRLKLLLDRSDAVRERVDKELRRIIILDGMSEARADLWYEGVRHFAGYAWEPKLEEVHEAPSGRIYNVLPGSERALHLVSA